MRTLDAGEHLIDAELAAIIEAWPNLPASTRNKIIALVRDTIG